MNSQRIRCRRPDLKNKYSFSLFGRVNSAVILWKFKSLFFFDILFLRAHELMRGKGKKRSPLFPLFPLLPAAVTYCEKRQTGRLHLMKWCRFDCRVCVCLTRETTMAGDYYSLRCNEETHVLRQPGSCVVRAPLWQPIFSNTRGFTKSHCKTSNQPGNSNLHTYDPAAGESATT